MNASATDSKRPATYADLEAVPGSLVAEIIDGALVTHPRPTFRHGGAASALNIRLGGAFQFDGQRAWGLDLCRRTGIELGPHVLVPDIAAWRRERLAALPETSFSRVTPDWVCEVLSGSTERRDQTVKSENLR